jgi:hypothetical protein
VFVQSKVCQSQVPRLEITRKLKNFCKTRYGRDPAFLQRTLLEFDKESQ